MVSHFFYLRLTACSPDFMGELWSVSELERLASRAIKVTLIRDGFGVPDIDAKTDANAGFGLLRPRQKTTLSMLKQLNTGDGPSRGGANRLCTSLD